MDVHAPMHICKFDLLVKFDHSHIRPCVCMRTCMSAMRNAMHECTHVVPCTNAHMSCLVLMTQIGLTNIVVIIPANVAANISSAALKRCANKNVKTSAKRD